MEILTLLNNNAIDIGGSGTNQGLLLAKALGGDILIPTQVLSDNSYVKADHDGTEIYYPSKSYTELIRDLNPDVLLIHYMELGLLNEIKNIKKFCKVVTITHENLFDLFLTDMKRQYLPYFLQFLDNSDLVICLSKNQQELLSNIVNTKLRVIPPAIEFDRYRNIEATAPNNDFIMGGRLVQIKQHVTPFIAMKEIIKKYPDAFLKVYEEGIMKHTYEEFILHQNLEQHIGLFGLVSHNQFISAMCISKALVVSSLNENNSVTCLEAQALGVPIIWENPFSPKDFSTKMLDVLDNYKKYKDIAESKRDAMKEYDIINITKKFKSTLNEVL